jgi:hypothetical protein
MNQTSNHTPTISPRLTIRLAAIGSVLLIALLLWLYLSQPFGDFWTDKITDTLILGTAVAAASAGSKFTSQFQQDEAPRRVWFMFSLGLWFWVAGEIGGMIDDALYWYTEYPGMTAADIGWLGGYAFIGLSLYYQYRLIFGKNNKRGTRYYLGLLLIALAAAALLTNAAIRTGLGRGYAWPVLFVTILYPVFDMMDGIGALYLSFLFGRGHWIRPWWGMILFAISDTVNIFYWLGGYDLLPEALHLPLDLISLFFYMASYLVMAISFLSLFYMSHYGKASGLLAQEKNRA